MSVSTQLSDDFLRIPNLATDCENWIIYKERLRWSMDVRGLLRHVDGTETAPIKPVTPPGTDVQCSSLAQSLAQYHKRLKEWKLNEAIVKQQIAITIPDALFIQVNSLATAHDILAHLANIFEKRSRTLSLEILGKMQSLKCPEKGNVREHFDQLRALREQLVSIEQAPTDESFVAVIIGSLPPSYDPQISAMTALAKASSISPSSDAFIEAIQEDYDRRAIKSQMSANDGEDDACSTGGSLGNPKFKGKCSEDVSGDVGPVGAWFADAEGSDSLSDESTEIDEEDALTTTLNNATPIDANVNESVRTELYASGASCHMSPYRDQFVNFRAIAPKPITAVDRRTFEAVGKGDVMISVPNGTSRTRVLLKNVLYAPEIGLTLVSISRLAAAGYTAEFCDSCCRIFDGKLKQLGEIRVSNGLYTVTTPCTLYPRLPEPKVTLTMEEAHARLAHLAPESIRKLLKDGTITGIVLDPTHTTMGSCDSCDYAEATRKSTSKVRDRPRREKFGDEVHMDLWGESPFATPSGHRYFVSFTDDHTRFTALSLLCSGGEILEAYKKHEAWVCAQRDATIKRLRSDRGGEFLSEAFAQHLALKGTERERTVHDTPEHVGEGERLSGALMGHARAMRHASGLPETLWGESLMHAVWLKNRVSTRALGNKTPWEMLFGGKPDLAGVPVWGCRVRVEGAPEGPTKVGVRARERDGRWVGFEHGEDGHRIYDEDTGQVGVERCVRFC